MRAKDRRMITHFQHSSQACSSFKNIQLENGAEHPLPLAQDVKIFWNSTSLMLQFLSPLKTAVQLYAVDHKILVPIPNKWQFMVKVFPL